MLTMMCVRIILIVFVTFRVCLMFVRLTLAIEDNLLTYLLP